MKRECTPLPWEIVRYGGFEDRKEFHGAIQSLQGDKVHQVYRGPFSFKAIPNEADAEFMVKAVNCHDELLEALESFMRAPSIGSDGPGSLTIRVMDFNMKAAGDAIAKAEGRQS